MKLNVASLILYFVVCILVIETCSNSKVNMKKDKCSKKLESEKMVGETVSKSTKDKIDTLSTNYKNLRISNEVKKNVKLAENKSPKNPIDTAKVLSNRSPTANAKAAQDKSPTSMTQVKSILI